MAPVLISVLQRLQQRGWAGDALLAADLLATVQGRDLDGRALAVDLDELTFVSTGIGGDERAATSTGSPARWRL